MYDFSGLWYCVYRLGGMLALPAIVLLICWRRASGRRRKLLRAFVLLALLLAVPLVHFGLALHSPQVELLEGAYTGSSRSTLGARSMRRYTFDTGEATLQTCQLDHLAAAGILPQDMQAGALYRVWYEARTDIIVKCEEVK